MRSDRPGSLPPGDTFPRPLLLRPVEVVRRFDDVDALLDDSERRRFTGPFAEVFPVFDALVPLLLVLIFALVLGLGFAFAPATADGDDRRRARGLDVSATIYPGPW